jgi:DNA-binding MarR family transcriptional regulator
VNASNADACYTGAALSTVKDTRLVGEWREILDRHARVSCALTQALEHQHGLGMSEFEVLERLASEGESCVRLQEVAEHVHLSQSALSRVVDRLEKHGLLKRGVCDNDRRAIYAELTKAGRERYEAARPTHREVLERELT